MPRRRVSSIRPTTVSRTTKTPTHQRGPVLEGLPCSVIGVGSGWLLAFVFVVLVYRGKLVPDRQVTHELDATAKALERAEHDRDEWRAESRIKDAQVAERPQLAHMGEVGRQVKRVLSALQPLPHAPEVDDQ